MNNKKIINSLNKVLPSKTTKNNILNNILFDKSKKSYNYLPIILSTFLCLVFIISNSFDSNNNSNDIPREIRTNINQIIYNEKCYEEKGIYNGEKNELEFIEESNEFIMGDKIYQKENSIFFENSDNYIEYILCKE